MSYTHMDKDKNYAPPIIGNGEIVTSIDYEGVHNFRSEFIPQKMEIPQCEIWWSGRRYIDKHCRELIPFGKIEQSLTVSEKKVKAPIEWEQRLDNKSGNVMCRCKYENGEEIGTNAFVHFNENVIAVQKKFSLQDSGNYEFIYSFCDTNEKPVRRVEYSISAEQNGAVLSYVADGQEAYKGVIRIFADRAIETKIDENTVILSAKVEDGDKISFYILFADDLMDKRYVKTSEKIKNRINEEGFEAFFAESKSAWDNYLGESYVHIDNERMQKAYDTAQYNLKVYTTPWSIPVGLNDLLWHGRYFGFDEYFSFTALMTSNHTELAKRVPTFRANGLKRAVERASNVRVTQAIYPWETVETGEESSPPGFWYEHIFHIAHIALESWEYYLYTNDFEFLKEKSYAVIKACSNFFLNHMIYEFDGNIILGKCSDLERLGPSVENPYMSSCSVIKTLYAMSKAAKVMKQDEELAAECERIACGLYKSLPNDGEKYIPCKGCKQKSIAVFSGLYPYNIMDRENILQLNAMEDYVNSEAQYGNMYNYGGGVGIWYAAWKSLAYSRIGYGEKTFQALNQAISSCGCFGEGSEINEKGLLIKPWFTTAAGAVIESVNEMLIQSNEDEVLLFYGLSENIQNVEFKLLTVGGVVVHLKMVDNVITHIKFEKKPLCVKKDITIKISDKFNIEKVYESASFYCAADGWNILKFGL